MSYRDRSFGAVLGIVTVLDVVAVLAAAFAA